MKSSKKHSFQAPKNAFMLDKTRKPLFPQLETKKGFFGKNSDFLFRKMSHDEQDENV